MAWLYESQVYFEDHCGPGGFSDLQEHPIEIGVEQSQCLHAHEVIAFNHNLT